MAGCAEIACKAVWGKCYTAQQWTRPPGGTARCWVLLLGLAVGSRLLGLACWVGLLAQVATKGKQRQGDELDVLQGKRDADNRDAQDQCAD